jgi:arylsulfatase A-like enzyme
MITSFGQCLRIYTLARFLVLILVASGFAPALAAEAKRPNIIFLLADDQRYDSMGAMGNPYAVTPNMDKLATEGVLFENAYLTSPICEPSRASIMLSQYQGTHRTGFDRPVNLTISKAEYAGSYPVLLRKAGYRTCFVGKFGFAVAEKKILNDGLAHDSQGKRSAANQLWKFEKHMPADQFDVWHGFPGQGNYFPQGKKGQHLTQVMGDQARLFLRDAKTKHGDQPFSLSISFKAPHSPMSPDPAYKNIHKGRPLWKPYNFGAKYRQGLPQIVQQHYRGRKGVSDRAYPSFIDKYFQLIHGIDVVLGQIRNELKQLGLADNTVIIYTSDNGYFCGSKGLSGKDLLYEESLRAPLIIFDPRLAKSMGGRRVTQLTSAVDFGPTMLDLAGIKQPESMQGRSLRPILNQEKPKWNNEIFAENFFSSHFLPALEDAGPLTAKVQQMSVRSKAVRYQRWKYIRYHEHKPVIEELYDLQSDALEEINLASKAEHANTLAQMRKRCDDWINKTQRKIKPQD